MANGSLKQRKILITVGAGFLGVHVARALAAAGARLLLQDTAHKRANLLAPVLKEGRADFVVSELETLDRSPALIGQLADVDYLVHLGLHMPAAEAPHLLPAYLAANLVPFEQLLQHLPSRLKGVVLASSLAVYGGPSAEPVSETYPTRPQSAFAKTKLAMELVLLQYGQRTGTPVTSLRFSSLYGPGETQSPRAVPSFIRNLMAGQPPVIYGDGTDVYDYLYVQDAARATQLALEHLGEAAGIYNIGSGHGWSTRAVAENIQRQMRLALPPKHMPARGPRHSLIADIGHAAARLHFRPETALEDGLAKEIAYFAAQQAGGGSPFRPFDAAHGLLMRTSASAAGH